MSGRKSNRKPRRRRTRRTDPLIWLAAIPIAIVAFLVFNAVQSGAFAKAPKPSRSEDPADLLPLAETGQMLRGGHDMALIPEQTPAPRAAPVDAPVPRLDMPSASHNFGQIYAAWRLNETPTDEKVARTRAALIYNRHQLVMWDEDGTPRVMNPQGEWTPLSDLETDC